MNRSNHILIELKSSSRTETDNIINVNGEGLREKKLFKRKEKCYECESTNYWQNKYPKQKDHGQNKTGKSASS